MPLYLDYNATSPIHPDVLDEMLDVYRHNFGNAGSRTHTFGERANEAASLARRRLAQLLAVDRSEIVFTSGATESDNLAILGLADWGREHNRLHIVSSAIEHKAVLEPIAHLAQHGFEVDLVQPQRDGRVRVDDVVARVRPDTLLVSVSHANNETGAIQPVAEIGAAIAETEAYLHVDAAQTCGKLVLELQHLKYDLLSVTAHKMYGPQGIGALVVRRHHSRRPPLRPLLFGGGQEGGLRPGTLPVALAVGFGKAASLALERHAEWNDKNLLLRESVLDQLNALRYVINGSADHSVPNCLNVSIEDVDSEALMLALRERLAVSNGSACTSAEYKPSHVLAAMRLPPQVISGAIRMSWGYGIDEIDLTPLTDLVRAMT